MTSQLRKLWERQQDFNDAIKASKPGSTEYWAKQYLLGISSEVGEVLREIVWKDHRKATQSLNRDNLGMELADLFKLTMCLFQLYHFTMEDMLMFVEAKTSEVEKRHKQEFSEAAKPGQLVVISDIDGTLGDWRKAFIDWHHRLTGVFLKHDTYSTMAMETEIGMPYANYQVAKEEFEKSGGYRTLPSFNFSLKALQDLSAAGAIIYVYTARPQNVHSRVWMDSSTWLDAVGLGEIVRELRIGSEQRIDFACMLQAQGCKVVMLEDDPALAIRAASAGIQVWLKHYPYNESVSHENIHRVTNFFASVILKEIQWVPELP